MKKLCLKEILDCLGIGQSVILVRDPNILLFHGRYMEAVRYAKKNRLLKENVLSVNCTDGMYMEIRIEDR